MTHDFNGCSSLEYLDLSGAETSHGINLTHMFDGCSALSTVKLGEGFSFFGGSDSQQCWPPEKSANASPYAPYSSGRRRSKYETPFIPSSGVSRGNSPPTSTPLRAPCAVLGAMGAALIVAGWAVHAEYWAVLPIAVNRAIQISASVALAPRLVFPHVCFLVVRDARPARAALPAQ